VTAAAAVPLFLTAFEPLGLTRFGKSLQMGRLEVVVGVATKTSLFEQQAIATRGRCVVNEVTEARTGRRSSYRPFFAKKAKHMAKLGATDADLARIFGVSDVTIDNWMARPEAFADVVLEYDRTESTARYLAGGRRFTNLETVEIKRRWTEATRTFLTSYGSVNPREMDDLASELGLRNVPLPVENVTDEGAAVARWMKRDNDLEVRARVRAQIRSLLEDLERRRN
jgi:transposase